MSTALFCLIDIRLLEHNISIVRHLAIDYYKRVLKPIIEFP